LFLSLIFNFAIAVFALVGGSYGWVNTYFGCNAKFSGVLESWRGIDSYLQKADQYLCSPQCPCYFTNSTGYISNPVIAPVYNSWSKSNVPPGNAAFQNCSSQVQVRAYREAAAADAYFDPEKTFSQENFANYMSKVENDFQCSGWCNVTYTNPTTGNNVGMYKYLFTNINRGPPVNMGCLDSMVQWLPPYLLAYGSITMVLSTFQVSFYNFSLSYSYLHYVNAGQGRKIMSTKFHIITMIESNFN
jgi:hypothetical protein